MLDLVNSTNDKLNDILNELSEELNTLKTSLDSVQEKIDSKIEEAKGYKTSVDEYKNNINILEEEISSFETDLINLKENYGNKGLDQIVEVGTKEINSKIMVKQLEISKLTQKINELTDRARTIKELLINLKKDKKDKKDKLDNLTVCYEYYKQEFNKIFEYSINNIDSLVYIPSNDIELNVNVPIIEEEIDNSPVFDEIESIDKEETNEDEINEPVINLEKDNNEVEETNVNNNEVEENLFNIPDFNINLDDEVPVNDVINEDEESHLDDTISSLFAKDIDKTIDFKALSDSIDKEYDDIFGSGASEEIELDDNLFSTNSNTNIFDKNSFLDEEVSTNIFGEEEKTNTNEDIVNNFFVTNKIDLNKFSVADKEYIRDKFNPIGFSKIIDVLKKHNIEFTRLYSNPRIFEMDANVLDGIITKLLISGQPTYEVSLVLDTLVDLSLESVDNAIKNLGSNIKNASITDIIISARGGK